LAKSRKEKEIIMTETEMMKRKLEIIRLILDFNDESVLLQCEMILKEATE
tara:strand:- start:589 stop:738 length:150 start_codon:yes stop_codon:yes gene_type:complete